MKKLVWLVLLFPALAFAAETEPNFGEVFANGLKLAVQVGGIPGAIILGLICLGYTAWKLGNYLDERGKREREAYELDKKIREQQAANLARMQKDASQALITNMDITYKQDYDQFVRQFKEGNYKGPYQKYNVKFHDTISKFVYDESIPVEERAARVILTVKP